MKQYDAITTNEVESKNGAQILSYQCHIDSASSQHLMQSLMCDSLSSLHRVCVCACVRVCVRAHMHVCVYIHIDAYIIHIYRHIPQRQKQQINFAVCT